MKNSIISAVALSLTLSTGAVFAQDTDTPARQSGEKRMQNAKELGITKEQAEELSKIRQQGGSREEMREVLTPEQRQQMRERRAERADHADLDLTDEQRQEIKKVRASGGSREDLDKILTPEQRKQLAAKRSEKGTGSKSNDN